MVTGSNEEHHVSVSTADSSNQNLPKFKILRIKLTDRAENAGMITPEDDWWSTLVIWEGSVFEEIWFRMAIVMAINLILCLLLQFGVTIPKFSSIPHNLVGLPLGLLLVFRTNLAYDRFWEGRKAWGTIIIQARIWSRLLGSVHPLHRTGDHFVNLFVAFTLALKHRLRGTQNTSDELDELSQYLHPNTLSVRSMLIIVLKVNNRPGALLRLLSEFAKDKSSMSELSAFLLPQLLDGVTQCAQSQACHAACERIINTPMPLPYLVQIRQLLILYTFTLPLIMISLFPGWVSLAGTFLLAFGLFGIEEAGKIIENPFGDDDSDLPLEKFCAVVETDMHQMTSFSVEITHIVKRKSFASNTNLAIQLPSTSDSSAFNNWGDDDDSSSAFDVMSPTVVKNLIASGPPTGVFQFASNHPLESYENEEKLRPIQLKYRQSFRQVLSQLQADSKSNVPMA